MTPEWVQTATAILGAVGALGGLGGAVAAFSQRKKARADAADVITDASLALIEPLKARVAELEIEVNDLRRWRAHVQAVIFTPTITVQEIRESVRYPQARNGRH